MLFLIYYERSLFFLIDNFQIHIVHISAEFAVPVFASVIVYTMMTKKASRILAVDAMTWNRSSQQSEGIVLLADKLLAM